jgi:hypothetical protein
MSSGGGARAVAAAAGLAAATRVGSKVKDRTGDQRGGSEWEPIKILLEGDGNSNKMNLVRYPKIKHFAHNLPFAKTT